jgi:dTDP-4-dehydrorhamnose reductase
MKILITGGSGLLGQYLNLKLSEKNQVLTAYNNNKGNCNNINSVCIDLRNYKKLSDIFTSFKPEVVIHTAAISTPSVSKSIPAKEIYNINVRVTAKIAQLCDIHKSKLIYTSTDLVYAGYRGSMLSEDAKLIPISLYAETKLMGEVKIQETFNNYLILRTALLYGFGLNHSICHFHKMYNDLIKHRPVKLFIDQFRSPLSLLEASRLISELVDKKITSGIINFGGCERLSRHELGERLCEIANIDKNLLMKIKMDDLPDVPKVTDVSLNMDKLKSHGIKQKSIEELILEIIKK